MNTRLLKTKENQNHIFDEMSSLLNSLASPVRLKLIHFLSQADLSVEVLAKKIDQSVANTSMHLRKMYNAKIVDVSIVGQRRLYRLHPSALAFWEKSQDFFQLIHPDQNLKTDEIYGELNWDNKAELVRLIKTNKAMIVDVRPLDELNEDGVQFSFIKHISSTDLLKSKWPQSKIIFIFCRGRFCALSADSVFQLRQKGYNAFRLPYSWFELQNLFKGIK